MDHVELQTCCGCRRCVYGQEEDQQDEEEACVEGRAGACLCCSHARRGLGCWRPVYQGLDTRCRVNLSRGNTLHYFRVLVRARLPPPDMRGFMRPQRAKSLGAVATTSGVFEQPNDLKVYGGRAPPDRLSPNRRTRRRERGHHPGVATVNSADQDENMHSVASPTDTQVSPRAAAEGVDAFPGGPGRGEGKTGESPTILHDDPEAVAAGNGVMWFASHPVFVDSRPPPLTLHGIGTALVLTWPALSGFSGEERLSYIVEQRSHANTPSPGGNNFQLDQGHSHELSGWPQSRQGYHNRQCHPAPPKYAGAKEVFSVGTRCWFMPTGLQTAMRYWYRLRLGHEGGKSVGGPWTSHTTSIAPPRCIRVECRALLLSLPRAIGDGLWSGTGDDGREQERGTSYEEQTACTAQLLPANSDTDHLSSQQVDVPSRAKDAAVVEGAGEGKEEQQLECEGGHTATPMVWYTLEGLDKGMRWVVLYRGSASEVIVKVKRLEFCRG